MSDHYECCELCLTYKVTASIRAVVIDNQVHCICTDCQYKINCAPYADDLAPVTPAQEAVARLERLQESDD